MHTTGHWFEITRDFSIYMKSHLLWLMATLAAVIGAPGSDISVSTYGYANWFFYRKKTIMFFLFEKTTFSKNHLLAKELCSSLHEPPLKFYQFVFHVHHPWWINAERTLTMITERAQITQKNQRETHLQTAKPRRFFYYSLIVLFLIIWFHESEDEAKSKIKKMDKFTQTHTHTLVQQTISRALHYLFHSPIKSNKTKLER